MKRMVGILPVIVLACCTSGLSSGLWAQTQPGAPTFTFDYRDVPADTILSDVAQRLGAIVIKSERLDTRISLASGHPVGIDEAEVILNDALWPLGFRLYPTVMENGGKVLLRIGRRPTSRAPAEMRIARHVAPVPVVGPPPDLRDLADAGTMKLQYSSAPVATILDDMGKRFGFVIDPPDALQVRLSILVPREVHAGEAVGLMSEALAIDGHKLEVNTVEDAAGGKRLLLRVVELKPNVTPAEVVDFNFDDAPLVAVVAELARRSGYEVMNEALDVKVTIHAKLTLEAAGTDVGPVVASLNDALLPLGLVMEETSRAGAGAVGEVRVPVLRVMTLEAARKTLLALPVSKERRTMPAKEWVGVDMQAALLFHYQNASIEQIMSTMSEKFGFIVMKQMMLPQRVTIEVPEAAHAEDAFKLLDAALLPQGYRVVPMVSESVKGTILRVMSVSQAELYLRGHPGIASTPGAADALGAMPPLPPGSEDDLVARMRARREAEQAVTRPGG